MVSPTPPDAQVGLPSEEDALAAYNAVWQSAPGIDAHNVELVRREAMAAVLDLIRPAFERVERERDEFYRDGLKAEDKWIELEAHALSAEAKLAQAVEALEPFASYHEAAEFLDDKGHPLPDDQHAGYVYLTMGAFRRAAAAMGEKT